MERAKAFGGRLVRWIERAGRKYGPDLCAQAAAAISYHVLFSVFPLLLLFVSILGLVLQDDARRDEVTQWVLDRVPLSETAGFDLEQAISGLATPFSIAGFVALIGLLWSASGMMASIRRSLTSVWDVRPHPIGRGKLLDFALVVGAGVLILLSLGATFLVRIVQSLSEDISVPVLDDLVGWAGQVSEALVPLALTYLTFLLLYRYVPLERPGWRDVWLGALVGAIGFDLLKTGFAVYLAEFANYNVIYGSLGAVIGFLLFVYLAASVFLFGAELAAAWPLSAEEPPPTEPGEEVPFRRKVGRFVRGLFVPSRNP